MEAILANYNKTPKEIKIALIGSSEFKNMFEYINRLFSLQGKIIYTLSIYEFSDGVELTNSEKMILHNTQKIKILNSDCVFVIDVDKQITEDVMCNIIFAELLHKPIYYLSEYLK